MTDKRYLFESQTTGQARVEEIGNEEGRAWVRLDKTWFHPQGGGQKADIGTIAGEAVTHVAHAPEGVRHYLMGTTALQPGQTVDLVVDPSFRRLSARLHTAGHLIAAVGEALHPNLTATMGHHWPGEARVEFAGDPLPDSEQFQAALGAALREALSRPCAVSIEGDVAETRMIKIGDHPAMRCGGTHLTNIADIGQIVVRNVKSKGGKLRVGYDLQERPSPE